jgi:tRNA threonylcarbamoyladenosine biosynthesis protein TsaB
VIEIKSNFPPQNKKGDPRRPVIHRPPIRTLYPSPMALILLLETATTVCSAALARDGKVLALRETHEGYSHAEKLTVFAGEILREAGITLPELDAVAVSGGPGSYTGLRIGVSTAKGLCFALDKPLISIGTLEAMAWGLYHSSFTLHQSSFLACPMIDARRMEVYCAVYRRDLSQVVPVHAEVVGPGSFREALDEGPVVFFGDGAAKCREVLGGHPQAVFSEEGLPSAAAMARLAETKFSRKEFEDLALYEPFYLKDFVAGGQREKAGGISR